MDRMKVYEFCDETERECLKLPIQIEDISNVVDIIKKRLAAYSFLISHKMQKCFLNDEIEEITSFVENLLSIVIQFQNKSIEYDLLNKFLEKILFVDRFINKGYAITEIRKDDFFYRARITDFTKDFDEFDMFHIPFDSPEKFSKSRFGDGSSTELYLCKTINGCKNEICSNNITIAKYKYKEDEPLKIFDLTSLYLNNCDFNKEYYYHKDDTSNVQFMIHLLWPIIALCYIVSPLRSDENLGLYSFPQMLARYLKGKVDGIRYFTVRYESLDPNNDDFTNIMLFTNRTDKKKYDDRLKNRFNIEIIDNEIKSAKSYTPL